MYSRKLHSTILKILLLAKLVWIYVELVGQSISQLVCPYLVYLSLCQSTIANEYYKLQKMTKNGLKACKCLHVLAYACTCLQILSNACKWQKMTKNDKKWLKSACKRKMLANACKCLQMLANAGKWQKNDKKWQQMTKNGLKMRVNGVFPISICVSCRIVDPQHRKW